MATVLPYELYSDAPGTLFVKHEWETANAAHPAGHDFGDVPVGWPRRLEGPLAWNGKDLQVHRKNESEERRNLNWAVDDSEC